MTSSNTRGCGCGNPVVMNHVCALDLTDDELELVLDALWLLQGQERDAKPRRAQNAHSLRRRFMLLQLEQVARGTDWSLGSDILPEST